LRIIIAFYVILLPLGVIPKLTHKVSMPLLHSVLWKNQGMLVLFFVTNNFMSCHYS